MFHTWQTLIHNYWIISLTSHQSYYIINPPLLSTTYYPPTFTIHHYYIPYVYYRLEEIADELNINIVSSIMNGCCPSIHNQHSNNVENTTGNLWTYVRPLTSNKFTFNLKQVHLYHYWNVPQYKSYFKNHL